MFLPFRQQQWRAPLLKRRQYIITNHAVAFFICDQLLIQLVEPFVHIANTESTYRRLLSLGILAWNAALAPDAKKQKEIVNDSIRRAKLDEDKELEVTVRALVNQLIARKKSLFSEYRRPIYDFVLVDTGHSYQVLVASVVV